MKKQKIFIVKWLLIICVVLTAAGLLIFQTSRYAAMVEASGQNALLAGSSKENGFFSFFSGIFGFGPNSFWRQMFHGNTPSSGLNGPYPASITQGQGMVQQAINSIHAGSNASAGNNLQGSLATNNTGNSPNNIMPGVEDNAGGNAQNENTGNSPANDQAGNPENNSGSNPGDNSSGNTGDDSGGNPTDNNGNSNPGDNSGGNNGDNPQLNTGQGTGNLPFGSSGGNPEGSNPGGSSDGVQYCVPGCYPGCIPGCDPLCTPPTCLLGNAKTSSLPPANPIPTNNNIAQIIAQQDQQIELLVQLLNEYQTLTAQVMEAAQAAKYQTVNSQDLPAPDDTPAPSDIVTKIQSGQLIQH